jgi:hypothetical protein
MDPHFLSIEWEDRRGDDGGGTVVRWKKGTYAQATDEQSFTDIEKALAWAKEILEQHKSQFKNEANKRGTI